MRDKPLPDLKLFPEHRRALELVNKNADGLRGIRRRKTACYEGQADDANCTFYCEDCQHSS